MSSVHMSDSRSSEPSPVVIARLRQAGCVFAEDEARLLSAAARTPDQLAELLNQRVAGLPLEHVLGWAEFGGVRIEVDAGVFIPRPRTEFLLEQAVALGQRRAAPAVAVDLCCGSGALGVALAVALEQPGSDLHAADIDLAAVRCAQRNVGAAGGQVYQGDLYEPLPAWLRGQVDLLLANVPYVPTGAIATLPAEARLHESRVALDGGGDGLDIQRRVAAEAPRWLAPGGHLLVEVGERQAPEAAHAFDRCGLLARVVSSDELNATVVIGTLPAG